MTDEEYSEVWNKMDVDMPIEKILQGDAKKIEEWYRLNAKKAREAIKFLEDDEIDPERLKSIKENAAWAYEYDDDDD